MRSCSRKIINVGTFSYGFCEFVGYDVESINLNYSCYEVRLVLFVVVIEGG